VFIFSLYPASSLFLGRHFIFFLIYKSIENKNILRNAFTTVLIHFILS